MEIYIQFSIQCLSVLIYGGEVERAHSVWGCLDKDRNEVLCLMWDQFHSHTEPFLELTEAHHKHGSMNHGACTRCVGTIYELFGEGLCC